MTDLELGAATLKAEPPDLPDGGVDAVAHRCLQKDPAARFQSAHELVAALDALLGASAGTERAAHTPTRTRWPTWALYIALLVGAAAGLLGGHSLTRSSPPVTMSTPASAPAARLPPVWMRLTRRPEHVRVARFTPDEKVVLYSTMWETQPATTYAKSVGTAETRALFEPGACVLAVSRDRQVALLQRAEALGFFIVVGTLAVAPLDGGAPRELATDVAAADWLPDGQLAVVRVDYGARQFVVEAPLGREIYRTDGGPAVRVATGLYLAALSPDGSWLAAEATGGGGIQLIPMGPGKARTLPAGPVVAIERIQWFPDGERLAIGGKDTGGKSCIWTQAIDGDAPRLLASELRLAGTESVAPDSQRLLARNDERLFLLPVDGTARHELTAWPKPWAQPVGWSSDAKTLFVRRDGGFERAPIQRYDLATGRISDLLELVMPHTYLRDTWVGNDRCRPTSRHVQCRPSRRDVEDRRFVKPKT